MPQIQAIYVAKVVETSLGEGSPYLRDTVAVQNIEYEEVNVILEKSQY